MSPNRRSGMWRDPRLRLRLVLLATVVVVTGCNTTCADLRYLALGDSYTIGEGVAPTERWPVQLAARLRADGLAVQEPLIIARTGWSVGELTAAMDAASLDAPYDLVTLLIGVNDQYRDGEAETYRAELRTLLARAVTLAGACTRRVLVVSIPDWGVTAFAANDARGAAAIGSAIDAFNAVARDEARRIGVDFIDITGVSRALAQRVQLVDDGLHPNFAQYRAWTDRIAPAARVALATAR